MSVPEQAERRRRECGDGGEEDTAHGSRAGAQVVSSSLMCHTDIPSLHSSLYCIVVAPMRSGAAEPIAAAMLCWLAFSDDDHEQVLCGILGMALLGLRLLLSVPLLALAVTSWRRDSATAAQLPVVQAPPTLKHQSLSRETLILALVPLNVEVLQVCSSSISAAASRYVLPTKPCAFESVSEWLGCVCAQCLPWTGELQDGLPTSELMAATAALSLSHGCSVLVLQAWYASGGAAFGSIDVGRIVVMAVALALSITALCCVGLRRSILLYWSDGSARSWTSRQDGSVAVVTTAVETISACTNSSSFSNLLDVGLTEQQRLSQLGLSTSDRRTAHQRSLHRQQAALVAARAAGGGAALQASSSLPAVDVRWCEGGMMAAERAERAERAATANALKRAQAPLSISPEAAVSLDALASPLRSRKLRPGYSMDDSVITYDDEHAGRRRLRRTISFGLNYPEVPREEELAEPPEGVDGDNEGMLHSAELMSSRVQRACEANTLRRCETAMRVDARATRARTANQQTRDRMAAEQAEASEAAAAVAQWRPRRGQTPPDSMASAVVHVPQEEALEHEIEGPSVILPPLDPTTAHLRAAEAAETTSRVERARRTNRVRRAREAFAGDPGSQV